jgi:hypothetical protein
MNWTPVILLLLALATAGCTTDSKARMEAHDAFLAGQNEALQQQQSAAFSTVTVLGPVQNHKVPWVVGLTLTQAIATANYLGEHDPKEIIITHQGQSARLNPRVLLSGVEIPLEAGDVIEVR